jgi:hypothetical protein
MKYPTTPDDDWMPIGTGPKNGNPVLASDGKSMWISSRRVGKYAGPSRGGMPTTGHDWITGPNGAYPRWWRWLPALPQESEQPRAARAKHPRCYDCQGFGFTNTVDGEIKRRRCMGSGRMIG